jgi:dCTP deaminase
VIPTRSEIHAEVCNKNIVLEPYAPCQLNPNSYNYRLGSILREVRPESSLGDTVADGESFEIEVSGTLLKPGRVYLGYTVETIGSKKYVVSLVGRSSVGRLGLYLQLSADLGNLGDAHRGTLELTCVQPIVVYPNMLIGQVTFWVPHGEVTHYEGPYTKHSAPVGNLRPMRPSEQ